MKFFKFRGKIYNIKHLSNIDLLGEGKNQIFDGQIDIYDGCCEKKPRVEYFYITMECWKNLCNDFESMMNSSEKGFIDFDSYFSENEALKN